MKNKPGFAITILLAIAAGIVFLSVGLLSGTSRVGAPTGKYVAITFDDLPLASITHLDPGTRIGITRRLLHAITSNAAPAVGFVNEYGLYGFGKEAKGTPDSTGILMLSMWLDSGLELGNHSFAHTDLHGTTPDKFIEDVIRGEVQTSKLMLKRNMKMRYFRYPYLHTGLDLKTKRKVERFLADRKYQNAPVTIDNEDYLFAAAYSKAMERGDDDLMRRIGAAYIEYTKRALEYSERMSQELFGRPISHVVLLHANALNSDYFGRIVALLKDQEYSFVSLGEALKDPAYGSRDTYAGDEGLSWLMRWAVTRGIRTEGNVYDDYPDVPQWISQAV